MCVLEVWELWDVITIVATLVIAPVVLAFVVLAPVVLALVVLAGDLQKVPTFLLMCIFGMKNSINKPAAQAAGADPSRCNSNPR